MSATSGEGEAIVNQTDLANRVRALPHRPGVYLFKDQLNRVIYVGKARDLHRRVSQYFHPSRRFAADRKTAALIESIVDIETHVVKSEPEALLLEGKLIKEFRPRFNISFRDDKRFLLVKVDLNAEWPRFQLTRTRKEDGCRYFGPFAHSGSLRNSINLIKKRFGIRSCRVERPGESDYRHCLDHTIKNCCAPCVGRITRADYLVRVEQACEFLEGESGEMLRSIEEEMKRAAERMEFEKAAQLRDMLEDLRRTTRPMKRFVRQFVAAINPSEDWVALGQALGLPDPPRVMECFDISNISTTHKVASMVCFKEGKPDKSHYRRYRITSVEGQDDFASMAEVIRRRYSRVLSEGIRRPSLIIVDGGKGQLSSAVRELRELGLDSIPTVGLAKENEEIFFPQRSEPLVLDKHSGALRLLQRIRDEAHRFANGYHQLLMKQRMTESILDECPGVSAHRKKLLLTAFGSIERLRRATVDEMAAVEGVGPRLAENIARFFSRLERRAEVRQETGEEDAGEEVAPAVE